jgi:hypothetical protein
MRATRGIGMVVAGMALLAACGGGGSKDSDSGGDGDSAPGHEQMCQATWDEGGKDQAAAAGQSKADYMDECIKVMSGAADTTAP